jgi:hypothetical protein
VGVSRASVHERGARIHQHGAGILGELAYCVHCVVAGASDNCRQQCHDRCWL